MEPKWTEIKLFGVGRAGVFVRVGGVRGVVREKENPKKQGKEGQGHVTMNPTMTVNGEIVL